jgi:hypothetical protein
MLPLSKARYHKNLLLVLCMVLISVAASAQFDSTKPRIRVDSLNKIDSPIVKYKSRIDSVLLRHSPKKAAIRSAIIPGWGQIYNKKYWKLPIVYGALGITAGIFIYNLNTYQDLRYAYRAKYNATLGDTSGLAGIRPDLKPLDVGALRTYRDQYRQNIDYSVLFFIIFWGLNVVDAAVDAHLKTFDVSPDLSLNLRVGTSSMAGTTGVSLVLAFK